MARQKDKLDVQGIIDKFGCVNDLSAGLKQLGYDYNPGAIYMWKSRSQIPGDAILAIQELAKVKKMRLDINKFKEEK